METNEPKSIAQACTRMGVAWDFLAALAEERGLNPHKVVTPVLCAALCAAQTDLIDQKVTLAPTGVSDRPGHRPHGNRPVTRPRTPTLPTVPPESTTYILPAGSPMEALEDLLAGRTPVGLLQIKNIYTYVAPDGTNTHIDVPALRAWIMAQTPPMEIWGTPIHLAQAKKFYSDNTVSPQRLAELSARPACLNDPILYCKDGHATNGAPDVMLADGHHRYVLHAIAGNELAPGWVLEEVQWRPFQITDLPDITAEALQALPVTKRNY